MEIIKKNFSVIIALIIAIVAGMLIYYAVSSQTTTTPIVVAKNTIMVGNEIKSEDLVVVQYPASIAPNTSFSSTGSVLGATVVNGPIIAGNVVRSENISDEGALRATLDTYATEDGWTAVELPPGGAIGMSSLRQGDKVDIYSEIGDPEQGTVIGMVCHNAIILDKPATDESDQFIVAVPINNAPAVAELIIRGKPMTLALNNSEVIAQQPVAPVPVEPAAE